MQSPISNHTKAATPIHNINDWWRGAVIYQIYPRSLKDTDGDGVGDLPGIIEKLDYIAGLGVDAIWISPIFKSPMQDFGYDVSDYRAIDPLFGTLADFDCLIAKAHALGLKVMIDQILSHTSDQHPWFIESRSDCKNDKAEWYVWADPKLDGSPPNNWLSIFGGCAWQWDARRSQYYLHNFLVSQPDLNYHNPQVRQQVLDEMEFWFERGVDGVRLDAINFCYHDKQLRDNPAKPLHQRTGRGFSANNPYAFQYHYYNNTQMENLDFLTELRRLLNRYPGTVALGEVSSEDSLQTMAEYTRGDSRLHLAYSFELLVDSLSTQHIRQVIEQAESTLDDGRACWAIGNHDVARVVTRWGAQYQRNDPDKQQDFAKLVLAFLMSLKGALCVYQGEELGLTEASLLHEQLRDPYGIAFWPEYKGRDGCRTPMPWTEQARHGGFTAGEPWLPLPSDHLTQAVDRQLQTPDSVLQTFKALIAWRKANPAIIEGSTEFIASPPNTLVFWRTWQQQHVLAGFNFSASPVTLNLESTKNLAPMPACPPQFTGDAYHNGTLSLAPISAFFACHTD